MNLKPEVIEQLERVLSAVEQLLPQAVEPIDWAGTTAANWRRHSFAGYLEPIENIENTTLSELVGIDRQKELLERNTCQFLHGFPANNALLWGSRGTGKSSLVRALLNKYAREGLRIIQIDKDDLNFLSDIFAQVGKQPYRFIILCDDLSFEADDPGYKILKSVLDGSVYAAPKNVLIYVTSNRRHLLPEYMRENGRGMAAVEEHHYYKREIQPGDHVIVKTCFIDFTEKWLHVWSVMINRITDEICAVNDQRCVHFDTTARRSMAFPAHIYEVGKTLVRERPEV